MDPFYNSSSGALQQNVSTKAATVRDSIKFTLDQAKQRLAMVERAVEILDKYPDIEELLNIMRNVGF